MARQLGIEAPPEPEVSEESPERPDQAGDRGDEVPAGEGEAMEGSPGGPVTAVAHPTERALGPFAAGIDELTAAVQQAEVAGDRPSEAGPAAEEEEAKRPAKRRRRRRRKLSRAEERGPTEDRASGPPASVEAEPPGGEPARAEGDRAGTEAEPATEQRGAKGRKRRRRGPKSETGPEATETPAAAEKEAAGRPAEAAPASSEKKGRERPAHRAIPSWGEAVDLIISRNLQARAKATESGSGRRHGGRRGNRSKAADRASGGSR